MKRFRGLLRKRSARRALLALLGVSLGTVGASVLIGDNAGLDRVSAERIASGVAGIADAVFASWEQIGPGEDPGWTGLRVYDAAEGGWRLFDGSRPSCPRAVVLVHGLDEPGGIWDQLAPALAAEGHRVVRFDYRNDQAIAQSASDLCSALSELRGSGVGEIDLVCHSMGGLVSRAYIVGEGFARDGPRVGTLITLGTPHKGSSMARLRAVAELREQVQRWAESEDRDPVRLLGFLRDGGGQAGIDLMPGSAFLRWLDEHPLPEEIRVICVVGRVDRPSTLVGALSTHSAHLALRSLLGEEGAGEMIEEIERLGRELGDGVVPASSAVMEGADEVIEVAANHRGMIRTIELEERLRDDLALPDPPEPPALRIVLERLRRD